MPELCKRFEASFPLQSKKTLQTNKYICRKNFITTHLRINSPYRCAYEHYYIFSKKKSSFISFNKMSLYYTEAHDADVETHI